MDFFVKDLIISVLPNRLSAGADGGWRFGGCDAGCTTCTGMTTCPGGCTGVTPHPRMTLYEEIINPVALANIKEQLREALSLVEAREQILHESMRPKSLAEVELLQAQLQAAQEDLKETARELAQKREE